MASLIDIARKKFLDNIRSVNPGRWKVLVVDEHSQKLLGATLKQYDVLAENVTTIEVITNNRVPEPNMEAMYLLMPTTHNVDRIIRDFSGQQMYSGAHLFFTDRLSEKLFNRLTSSPAERFLKTLVDLHLNFWAVEAQVYSLYAPSLFFSMFSPSRTPAIQRTAKERLMDDLRFVSKSIVNVCIQLNEYPTIRYYLPSHHPAVGPLAVPSRPPVQAEPEAGSSRWRAALGVSSKVDYSSDDHLSKVLAFMVQEELDEYKAQNEKWPENTGRAQSTLIVTDRSMDMAAPLVHEFTYQAMCNDLLDIVNGVKFRYKFRGANGLEEDKTATISDADKLWTQTRHMHMRETIDKLMGDFNTFLEQNAGFKGEGAASLNDMKDMLANLPQYQEQREQFSLHLNMAQQCMDLFEKRKLTLTANVEQNCATGVTPEGRTPKTLVEDMVPLLADSALSNSDKMRIMMLYIMYRDGVPEEDLRRLFEHARLTKEERTAINNMSHLGVRVIRGPNDRDTRKKIKNRVDDDDYDLSRFKPVLKTVIEDLVSGKLDPSWFPFVKEQAIPAGPSTTSFRTGAASTPAAQSVTSLRNKPVWTKGPRVGAAAVPDNRQRVLVFVAGGATYSEARTVYQLSKTLGKDIYLGTTHTITPEMLLDDLKVLELGGQGSQSIPNGLPETSSSGSGPKPFQQYYDAKYWTRDAPAPAPSRPGPQTMPGGVGPSGGKTMPGGGGGLPAGPGGQRPGPSPAPSSSPMPSNYSGSSAATGGKDKDKKRRFLGF